MQLPIVVTTSPHVLVVEDDVNLRLALGRLFTEEGYDVGVATNGIEAFEWLEHNTPCAVILDLLMPGVVGQELLEHLRTSPTLANIPIAIVTGSPELAPPGYKVFPKPVDTSDLLAFVHGACPLPSVGQR